MKVFRQMDLGKWGIICVALVALWFFLDATKAVVSYTRLNTPIQATVEKWEILKGKGDHFALIANLQFEYGGKTYFCKAPLGRDYPNHWAAQKALEKKSVGICIDAWINPKRPEHLGLKQEFPWKKVLSAAAICILLAYFSCLRLYFSFKDREMA